MKLMHIVCILIILLQFYTIFIVEYTILTNKLRPYKANENHKTNNLPEALCRFREGKEVYNYIIP